MKKKNISFILFIVSFIILVIYGIILSYNYRMDLNTNLLFDSDTARVTTDTTEIIGNHYRLSVHPLLIIFIQPLIFLLKGVVLNKRLAIIILSALTSSLSIVYIYKILSLVSKNKKMNILLSCIYLFSFSNIIYTAGIEIYNFAALFLIVLWYYFIKKQKEEYNIYSYIFLVILGILSAAFTITNIIVFLIVLFLLLVNKKIKLKNIIIIGLTTLIMIVGLSVGQRIIWGNTPIIWRTSVKEEGNAYSKLTIKKKNIKNVLINDYYNPILSSDIKIKTSYGNFYNKDNYILTFKYMDIFHFLLVSVFYILFILLLARNWKKNKSINIGLLLTLFFNTALHLVYGNNSPFLYSLHFLYLIILLFGINLAPEENKKFKKICIYFLSAFLLVEIINNNIIYLKILKFVDEIINKNYFLAEMGSYVTISIELLMIVTIMVIIYFAKKLYKKMSNEFVQERKKVYRIGFIVLIMAIPMTFIMLESYNQNILLKQGETYGAVTAPTVDHYRSKDFNEYFKTELESLNSYTKEMTELKKEYQTETAAKVDWEYYYYFGMAGRRKIIYIDEEIRDIDTKKVLYSFDVEEIVLVPNEYSVLIQTKNKDLIKIYEDNKGVHINQNGKDEIIEGTEIPLDLYSFENYKYKNTLKTLYGELLFNIKEGIIYPNIIAYDKPWYRDAAMTSMVLQKTNNIDLIKDWVLSIEEIYDKQNAGISEPDNLGELLYLISTQEERNEELIDRIEEEANRLAESNPEGYYIYGKTDFGDMYLYQNLWYKLGIESVGRKFNFDLDVIPKDNYTNMAWWSDYSVENESYEVSLDYPYLSYAMRHKLGNGAIPINEGLYPLSVEINASEANYQNYKDIDGTMINLKASPLHAWASSELMLLLMDEK